MPESSERSPTISSETRPKSKASCRREPVINWTPLRYHSMRKLGSVLGSTWVESHKISVEAAVKLSVQNVLLVLVTPIRNELEANPVTKRDIVFVLQIRFYNIILWMQVSLVNAPEPRGASCVLRRGALGWRGSWRSAAARRRWLRWASTAPDSVPSPSAGSFPRPAAARRRRWFRSSSAPSSLSSTQPRQPCWWPIHDQN